MFLYLLQTERCDVGLTYEVGEAHYYLGKEMYEYTQPIQEDIHSSNFPSFIPVMVDEKRKAKTTTTCLLNDELRVSE